MGTTESKLKPTTFSCYEVFAAKNVLYTIGMYVRRSNIIYYKKGLCNKNDDNDSPSVNVLQLINLSHYME